MHNKAASLSTELGAQYPTLVFAIIPNPSKWSFTVKVYRCSEAMLWEKATLEPIIEMEQTVDEIPSEELLVKIAIMS